MVEYTKLSPEQLDRIRELERELGDLCLVAVDRAEAMYAVEAKMRSNQWKPIDEVYDIEGLRSYYESKDDALKAKNSLKSFLTSKAGKQFVKRPIRVVDITENQSI